MTEIEFFHNRAKMLALREEFLARGLKKAVVVNTMVIRTHDGKELLRQCDEWLVSGTMEEEVMRWIGRFGVCFVAGKEGIYRLETVREGEGYTEHAVIGLQSVDL